MAGIIAFPSQKYRRSAIESVSPWELRRRETPSTKIPATQDDLAFAALAMPTVRPTASANRMDIPGHRTPPR